ncbi:23S rRNA (uracil(1939)-C(5))-methyltransferase RlmD [Paenibacillus sp. J5C_2022]|uniref:23S rRNA (uracil(1939)-C(5))-methyltransferase RlmD n=1 Tax=Paenibacillus sp. J5C2022 TaxID=2977129 RepID=UPI0021CECB0E|nr:23S rRNA (uracil(1939)-C(5))-methyltransferase RlmD [Paenibacillus sp. J5C2022]MCU6708003.1 23S rRNA (uracil(1939)-C(5))-methyltransferase RlmD [Paenibacillus sp. J5C2022]
MKGENKHGKRGGNERRASKPAESGSGERRSSKPAGSGGSERRSSKPTGSGGSERRSSKPTGSGGGERRSSKPAGSGGGERKTSRPTEAGGKRPHHGKGHAGREQVRAGNRPAGERNGGTSAEQVKAGDRIVVTIKRIGINGEGVGYYKRKAVFIKGALPGEVVKAKVSGVERGYMSADVVEIEKRSKQRQEPMCEVYDTCGGCQLQHMTYDAQLEAKEEIVREAFRRYTGLEDLPLRVIIGMGNPWGYRNKAQLQTGQYKGEIITGLYAAGSHRLVDISGCAVQHPAVNRTVDGVKRIMAELDIPIYDERKREGAVRTIVARVGTETGKVQLTLITVTDRLPDARRLVQRVRDELPDVVTIAHNVNKGKSPLIFGERTAILWGEERLGETLGDVQFSLSPRAFFQLNPEQTVKLYDAVREAAELTGTELVVDAYCGTGTIGLWLAPHACEVRGIELIPESVSDARDNARTSGIENTRFYEGRAEQLLPEWVAQGVRPDVVVVDPPRTGCELPLLQAIVKSKPRRLVYVSCNPSTLAKDCKVLLENGYRLEWVQPVDMFPQTAHVECVVGICRIDT